MQHMVRHSVARRCKLYTHRQSRKHTRRKCIAYPLRKSTIEIGDDVSIGHNVTIHGATIKDGALVGMGSVILDHAVVGEGAIVAAGAVVLSKTVIKPGELWGGAPAKFIKMVDPQQSKEINQK